MKFSAIKDVKKNTTKKKIYYEDEEEDYQADYEEDYEEDYESDGVSYMEDFQGLDYMGYDYQGTEILWHERDLTSEAIEKGFYFPEDEFNDENIGDSNEDEEDEDPATDPDRCIF